MTAPDWAAIQVEAQLELARLHVDSMTARRFRFLQDRVAQRYGRRLGPQQAAMLAAVDRYRHKRGPWT
jgi:hypothetical protein